LDGPLSSRQHLSKDRQSHPGCKSLNGLSWIHSMPARGMVHSVPYSEDLIKDWNTICGGPDPVAVDTVCEALMDWDYPGTNAPAAVLGAAEGLGTNRLEEIEITWRAAGAGETPVQTGEHCAPGPISERQRRYGLRLRCRL
jgi:hypothetical protein